MYIVAMRISVRQERPADDAVIARIVKHAFAEVSYSDHREHHMVARLRATDAFVPELSLLAEAAGEAVGHILMTRLVIRSENAAKPTLVPALALAPLSVVPAWQRRGVGRRLVLAAHERAAALGFGIVVLVGSPAYYSRFGYGPLAAHAITIPFDVPVRNRMILALRPGALAGVAGTVVYPSVWMEH